MKHYRLTQGGVWVFILCILTGVVSPVFGESAKGEEKGERVMTVSGGKEVSIEYTLKLEDQSVVDTNVGGEPLVYVQGSHQIIPGLEKAMEGMKSGENRQITVKPEEGYGKVEAEALVEVDKKQVPPDAQKVGAQLQGQNEQGQVFTARVLEVRDEKVLLDFNHPLAGKTLYFDIKVLNVKEVQ
jgi:FKBP-type peptidyl-prolyl cis-trans isomerase SlyD